MVFETCPGNIFPVNICPGFETELFGKPKFYVVHAIFATLGPVLDSWLS